MKMTDPDTVPDELPPEYRFDYSKARPNRFAPREAMPCEAMPRKVGAKSRRKPPRVVALPRLVVPGGMGFILAFSVVCFIHFTQITLYQQAHFAPDSAHPWDGYAALSLFAGMVSLAGLLLSLRDPAPMRWRRGRIGKRISGWGRAQAKQRRSGTIKPQ